MSSSNGGYYLPEPSHWPIVGSIGMFTLLGGFGIYLNGGTTIGMWIGAAILLVMLFGWFGTVINESEGGKYNDQVDMSFRWSMGWFIFSEVMFFAAFFGALFYARMIAVPWLGGAGNNAMTNELLWPGFEAVWPLLTNPDNELYKAPQEAMHALGLPAINTAILLASSVTITIAHHALRAGHRKPLKIWLAATIVLGVVFLFLQAEEYVIAYRDMGLTMQSGIYGSTFFMLTGFHGFHVTMGATMLIIMFVRVLKGHFTAEKHFAFEAVAWYWHFVDVVWLGLYIFVYWL
jgi:cytochrome c oxidase subunit 3